ncbi:MAG: YicC/YloC family endoribonuclease [Bacteroidales bacterium]
MIVSMTGYGKAICQYQDKTIKTEIRALNSKNLDLSIKTPNLYRDRENTLRNLLSSSLERGKIDFSITLEQDGNSHNACGINRTLLKTYFTEIKDIARELDVSINDNFLSDLIRLPDILKTQTQEVSDEEWMAVEGSVKQAIADLNAFRRSEGKHLQEDILQREQKIRGLLDEITPYEKDRIRQVRERINRSLKELSESIKADENRFEQEILFYLEKLDITEEKVRLRKHLDYFNETLTACEGSGKKLGFIAQEIGREINTIGSKANDAAIQRIVVQMKDELEKIKEQLMNVL